MTCAPSPTSFVLYRWANPQTTSDYPYLAVAQDQSALLSLGDYDVTLDWGIPEEASAWLARDFAPTGEVLECDLSRVRAALTALFPGDAEFALVRFGAELLPSQMQLVLTSQEESDQGPEYVIQGVGSYLRLDAVPRHEGPSGAGGAGHARCVRFHFCRVGGALRDEDYRTTPTPVS